MSTTKLRVALAQTTPVSGPPEQPTTQNLFEPLNVNLNDAKRRVAQASKEGADVVVFPEYFLQGLVDQGRQVSLMHWTGLSSVLDISWTIPLGIITRKRKRAQHFYRRIDSHASMERSSHFTHLVAS